MLFQLGLQAESLALFGAIGMLGLLDKRRAYWRSQAKLMGFYLVINCIVVCNAGY